MNNFAFQDLFREDRHELQNVTPKAKVVSSIIPTRIAGATPGCYAMLISDVDYHQFQPGVSSTGLKKVLRSPGHYEFYRATGSPDTPARLFGRAVHCYVLEPSKFDKAFAVWNDGDRRGVKFDEFKALHPNKGILTPPEMERVIGCAQALERNSVFPLRGFLDGARSSSGADYAVQPADVELSVFWEDEESGLLCKVRFDGLQRSPAIALDIKTTGDARPRSFVREIARMDYDLSAAFYLEGMRRFLGRNGVFISPMASANSPV